VAIDNHVDVKGPLQKIGLLSSACSGGAAGGARLRRPPAPSRRAAASRHRSSALQLSVSTPSLPPTPAEDEYDDKAAEAGQVAEKGWLDRALTGGSSTLALAFLCNKALFPIRTPITLGLTPVVAR
jgi:hypothetical protein